MMKLISQLGNLSEERILESNDLVLTPKLNSIDYIMELHREIERLKTEKLMLLRSNLENQDAFEEMKKKQEELEKANSLRNDTLKQKLLYIACFFLSNRTFSNFYL